MREERSAVREGDTHTEGERERYYSRFENIFVFNIAIRLSEQEEQVRSQHSFGSVIYASQRFHPGSLWLRGCLYQEGRRPALARGLGGFLRFSYGSN